MSDTPRTYLAMQTPLVDLLDNIPEDARLTYEVDYQHHQMIPVGRLAAEASARIKELEREAAALRNALLMFDALIKHQYSGSREAMSDMHYAAQNAARLLKVGAWSDTAMEKNDE
jgi:hypothetical protein